MICYALTILVAILLRIYLTIVNKHRDQAEGLDGEETQRESRLGKDPTADDYEDTTDFQTRGFRYRM
jgi:hypothetical protein